MEGCNEGCTMTWREYHKHANSPWFNMRSIISCAFEHPHLSRDMIHDQDGCAVDWPINEIMYHQNIKWNGMDILDIIDHLLENGADVNQAGTCLELTPLMQANNRAVFDHLLMRGANIKQTYHQNQTILHYYVNMGKYDFLREIMYTPGIDELIDVKSTSGETAYDLMTKKDRLKYPDVAYVLSGEFRCHRNVKRAR